MRELHQVINVGYFDELSEEAQETIIDKYRDYLTPLYEYASQEIISNWENVLQDVGFIDAHINYRGFCSQGDGACFTASSICLSSLKKAYPNDFAFLKNCFIPILDKHIDFTIERHDFHYSHKYSVNVEVYGWDEQNERLASLLVRIQETIVKIKNASCDKIYEELEAEYDYLTSEEALKEYFINNDFEFTEDGDLF